MATITANILIGKPHPNHNGIISSHFIFLSENDRPALILVEANSNNQTNNYHKITWIPSVETMLEDLLLMIGINIIKNQNLNLEFYKNLNNNEKTFTEILKYFDKKTLNTLYMMNKKVIEEIKDLKIIISIFKGSTLENQVQRLKKYIINIEICRSLS